MEYIYNDYLISDDKSRINLMVVKRLLSNSYWANDRKEGIIAKTIINSHCIGVYYNEVQIGFARIVTDYAVFAWIADIIIDEKHRRKGLGKKIIEFIQNIPEIPKTTQMLRTKDAHTLYDKYGFKRCECMSK